MSNGKLEPSIFILRKHFENFYSRDLLYTDFLVLIVLHEQANIMNGVARVSYNGFAALTGLSTNTVKNAIQRLVELEKIVVEPTKQGQKAFKVGVVGYYCKEKIYTTAISYKHNFARDVGSLCKVNGKVAKSERANLAKSEPAESSNKTPKEWIKHAKSIIDNPAKSLDIDLDRDSKINLEGEKDIDRNSSFEAIGQCLPPVLSSPVSTQLSFVLRDFDLTRHPDWNALVKRFGRAKILEFIETAGESCRATTLGGAFGFVYKGLEKRKQQGWL